MKKFRIQLVLMLALVVAMAGSSSAYIRLTWNQDTATVEFGQNPADYGSDGTIGVNDGALVQLIWAPMASTGPAALNPFDPTTPTGAEQVLDTGMFQSISPGFEGWIRGYAAMDYTTADLVGIDNATMNSGHVYLRVFDTAAPTIGDHYLEGGWVQNLTPDPGQTFTGDDVEYTGGEVTALNMTIVPEPGTFALFGIGLVTLVARRRRRS